MVAIKVNEYLTIGYLNGAARRWVRVVDADIGLVQFTNGIVNNDVDLLLISVIEQFRNILRVILRRLDNELGYVLSALVEIGIKVVTFVIGEGKVLILHPVLPKSFRGARLRKAIRDQEKKGGKKNGFGYRVHPDIISHLNYSSSFYPDSLRYKIPFSCPGKFIKSYLRSLKLNENTLC